MYTNSLFLCNSIDESYIVPTFSIRLEIFSPFNPILSVSTYGFIFNIKILNFPGIYFGIQCNRIYFGM